MEKYFMCFFMLIFVYSSIAAGIDFDIREYHRMPPQYNGEGKDYDRCLTEKPDAAHCMVHTVIKPDNSSPIWHLIEKYSSNKKKQFRHDLLQFGICIHWCEEELRQLDKETFNDLFEPEFDPGFRYFVDHTLYYKAPEDRLLYDQLVNRCTNLRLRTEYNLTAYSIVQFCTHSDENIPIDFIDIAFLVVLFSILSLLALSTTFDARLNKAGDSEHYQQPYQGGKSLILSILLAFSLPRNWYRLTAKGKTELAKDFKFTLGIRYLTVYLVVLGHTVMAYAFAPTVNPEFFEKEHDGFFSMLLINGMNVVQTFFTLTGVLMALQFFQMSKNKPFSFNYFWIAMVYRFIRLTPVYAFLILFEATWLYRLDQGPMWKVFSETERSFCRRNWWTNMLYINNYVNPGQMCMIHSWYLATDAQLFILGLVLLMAMWRFPKIKNLLIGTAIGISYVIPAVVTYIHKWDGVFFLTPQDKKFAYQSDSDQFLNYYFPAHTNAGNFLTGIWIALLYLRHKECEFKLSKSKIFVTLFYLVPILGALNLLSGWFFQNNDYEKPAIWIAIFAAVSKNMWGILAAILMLGLVSNVGSAIRRLLNLPIFTPLGRITYCVYLSHFIVMRFLTGDARQQIYASYTPIMEMTSAAFFLSSILGLVLCLSLEFPVSALLNEVLRIKRKNPEEQSQSSSSDTTSTATVSQLSSNKM